MKMSVPISYSILLASSALTVSMLSSTLAARAAVAGSFALAVTGGASVPSGTFDETANSGWDAGGSVTWMRSDRSGLGVDVVHHAWDGTDDEAAEAMGGPGSHLRASMIQTTAHYLRFFSAGGAVTPWFKIGLGAYDTRMRIEGGSSESDNREANLGANLGLGTDYAIGSGWHLGLGGTYHLFRRKKIPPPSGTGLGWLVGRDEGEAESTTAFTINATVAWRPLKAFRSRP